MEGEMNMNKLEWLLQDLHDADDGANSGGSDPASVDKDNKGDDPGDTNRAERGEDTPNLKYTDDDVNDIVNKKFAKWKKELEEEKKKAEKRAKLSEEERVQEEKRELEEKIAEYERKERVNENAKQISNKLSAANLPHDEELITLITSDDEDASKDALNVIIDYVAKIKKNNTITDEPNEGGKFDSKGKKQSLAEMAKEKRIIK